MSDQYGSPEYDDAPNRQTLPNAFAKSERRPRGRVSRVAIVINALVIAVAGVAIGHVAWRPAATTPSANSVPSPGSTNNGSGSSGSGTFGSGNSGIGYPGFGSSGSGSSGSGAGAAGGPTDAASIAEGVDSGLVDVNTTLGDEDEEAAGTGMVLTSNGEVLTNNHVIEDATSISVTDVGNGKTYRATVVGYDRTQDVAVLQLENASGLQTVSLNSSANVKVGEAIVGIGNAGGSGGTPSYSGGSVTALDQSINASDEGDGTSEQLTGLIETNADIQPGDSGGPLVDSSGKVIGMDTAASAGFEFESPGSSTTQGFSIPISEAIGVVRAITAGRSSATVHVGTTAFLGVEVQVAQVGNSGNDGGFGFSEPNQGSSISGAVIEEVVPGSPAAEAGLAEGDTITSFDGKSVTTPESLTTIIAGDEPGTAATLIYLDPSGQQHSITVRLVAGPPQ